MSLKSRSNQIKEQVNLINGYCVDDKYRKVIGMRSLSNNATNYHSELVCTGFGYLSDIKYVIVECQCYRVTGVGAGVSCEGSKYTVCRHCAAAFKWSNQQSGKVATLFDKFSDAIRYLNFGGRLVKLMSGKGEAWAVVRQPVAIIHSKPSNKELKPAEEYGKYIDNSTSRMLDDIGNKMQRMSLVDRVNLLRGEIELKEIN